MTAWLTEDDLRGTGNDSTFYRCCVRVRWWRRGDLAGRIKKILIALSRFSGDDDGGGTMNRILSLGRRSLPLRLLCVCVLLVAIAACQSTTTQARSGASATSETQKPRSRAFVGAQWDEGDARTYLVTRQRRTIVPDAEAQVLAAAREVTVRVLRSGAEGYVLEWTSDPEELIESRHQDLSLAMTELIKSISTVRYQVTEEGEFVELINRDEIVAALDGLVEVLGGDPDLTPGQRQGMRRMLDVMMSDANIDGLLAQELLVFHSLHGYEYSLDAVLTFEEDLPSRIGGKPIPTTTTFFMTENSETGTLEAEQTQEYNPVALARVAQELFGDLLPEGYNQPLEDATEEAEAYQAATTYRWHIDEATGWPTIVESTESMVLGGQGRIDTFRMVILEQP
jgi:hypothetical protein